MQVLEYCNETYKQFKNTYVMNLCCKSQLQSTYNWSMLNHLNIPNIMYNRSCTNSLWKQQFNLIIY